MVAVVVFVKSYAKGKNTDILLAECMAEDNLHFKGIILFHSYFTRILNGFLFVFSQ